MPVSLRRLHITISLILAWTIAVTAGVAAYAMYGWRPPVTRGDDASLERHLTAELQDSADGRRLASAVLVLIRGGRIASAHAFGIAHRATGARPTPDGTLYVLASVSKAVTAWGVMKLVEDGRLRLDDPVMPRLRRWRFPSSGAYRDRVTVRHLLSHTAGLDDGLGYSGFGPGEAVPSIEESLTLARDSSLGSPRAIVVTREPGTAMAYSGGGFAVLQLLVEEVTGQPFARYMDEAVLRPLGMSSASFDAEALASAGRARDVADGVNAQLVPQPPRRYAAVASVGLHATADDAARFAQAFTGSNAVLAPETLREMLTAQPATGGSWALGHAIFADAGPGLRIVGHDGGTPPSWGASMRVNPATGDALVLLASGGGTLVTRLADAWTYWQTGIVTSAARRQRLVDLVRPTAVVVAIGVVVLLLWRPGRGRNLPWGSSK